MSAAAAKYFIRIEEVLQEITDEGAIAEGTTCPPGFDPEEDSPSFLYSILWDEINGEESWNNNPWVWVYKFELLNKKEIRKMVR